MLKIVISEELDVSKEGDCSKSSSQLWSFSVFDDDKLINNSDVDLSKSVGVLMMCNSASVSIFDSLPVEVKIKVLRDVLSLWIPKVEEFITWLEDNK